jgi:hypothetical protein
MRFTLRELLLIMAVAALVAWAVGIEVRERMGRRPIEVEPKNRTIILSD